MPPTDPTTRLREMVEQWRAMAVVVACYHATMGTGWSVCADELEALVGRDVPPLAVKSQPELNIAPIERWVNEPTKLAKTVYRIVAEQHVAALLAEVKRLRSHPATLPTGEIIDTHAFARMGAWVIRLKAACQMIPGYLASHANNLDELRAHAGDNVRQALIALEDVLAASPAPLAVRPPNTLFRELTGELATYGKILRQLGRPKRAETVFQLSERLANWCDLNRAAQVVALAASPASVEPEKTKKERTKS